MQIHSRVDAKNIIEISNLDFFYGAFHSLKRVNLFIR